MGQVLYRKHRPKSLKEVVGQEHITSTLSQALKQGRISHAYLFTGPKGVGKTSIARILAHEINDLAYTDDSAHMDIIEIDAASNRRIDEIRELRDKVYVAPTSAKYKVYIIDEVHMLTREAFNALLKTLEEPPEHVVFILATTDSHKLPETIVSRTQRFSFKPVDKAKIVEHLADIAKAEGIQVSHEALELLAEHGEGSFRDSISLLDQASSQGSQLEPDDVYALLGVPSVQSIDGLYAQLASGASNDVAQALESLYNQGFQAAAIAKQLAKRIRHDLLQGAGQLPADNLLDLLTKLIEVPIAHDPERFLEIVLLQLAKPSTQPALATEASEVPLEPVVVEVEEIPVEVSLEPEPNPEAPETMPDPPKNQNKLDKTVWPEVLKALKQKHNTLYSVIRMAEPDFSSPGSLKLGFAFAFHQKRSNENGNRQLLSEIIKDLTGEKVVVECIVNTNANPPKITVEAPKPEANAQLSAISNIFGSAELLES